MNGFNIKNKDHIKYPNVSSVTKPVPYGSNNSVPSPTENARSDDDVEDDRNNDDHNDDQYDLPVMVSEEKPQFLTQSDLNDLVRDFNLTKENAELLESRLKERNLLAEGTTFYWYRNREKNFLKFFSQHESLIFYNNVAGVMKLLGLANYKADDWRLFIDSFKTSLKKLVLLHNGSEYAPVPITHSVQLKETCENIKTLIEYIVLNMTSING